VHVARLLGPPLLRLLAVGGRRVPRLLVGLLRAAAAAAAGGGGRLGLVAALLRLRVVGVVHESALLELEVEVRGHLVVQREEVAQLILGHRRRLQRCEWSSSG